MHLISDNMAISLNKVMMTSTNTKFKKSMLLPIEVEFKCLLNCYLATETILIFVNCKFLATSAK